MSWLTCWIGDDGDLHDCTPDDKATLNKAAAMRELAPGLKVRSETSDGLPTRGQLVSVKFDWVQLRLAAKPAPSARR